MDAYDGATKQQVAGLRAQIRRQTQLIEALSRRTNQEIAREVDSAIFLHSLVTPQRYVPPAGGWAASYETLAYLVDRVLASTRPLQILEVGSGVSTVWLSLACQLRGESQIMSIEHDEHFCDKNASRLRTHTMEQIGKIVHCPLVPIEIDDVQYQWYDVGDVTIPPVGLLFVDGPPGDTGERARYPAFPVLRNLLESTAIVVLDDTDRPTESQTVADWIAYAEQKGDQLVLTEQISRSTVLEYTRANTPAPQG